MLKLFSFLTLILQAFSYSLKLGACKICLKVEGLAIVTIDSIKAILLSFRFILINIVDKSISFIISNNWFILTFIHFAAP